MWRKELDSGKIVAAAFDDFDCVRLCFTWNEFKLVKMLERQFGITGSLLEWLKDYLNER